MTGEHDDTAVTDPTWEDALRAGMDEDGESGSVEPELAIARLLLHARAPAELTMARQDAIWAGIDGAITPVPRATAWWRRTKLVWAAPLAAVAAAVVLVVVLRPETPGPSQPTIATAGKTAMAETLEKQFAMLAPTARADVARRVDKSRGSMRGDLLAMARGSGTQGGAP